MMFEAGFTVLFYPSFFKKELLKLLRAPTICSNLQYEERRISPSVRPCVTTIQ